VILTRARQGMIIFVPWGSVEDPTRPPVFYDQTFEFLHTCGLRVLGDTWLGRLAAEHGWVGSGGSF